MAKAGSPGSTLVRLVSIVFLAASAAALLGINAKNPAAPSISKSTAARSSVPSAHVMENYAHLPLSFEPNRGQADRAVDFVSRGRGFTVLLGSYGATFVVPSKRVGVTQSHWTSKNRGALTNQATAHV